MNTKKVKIWHPIIGFIVTLIMDIINDTYLFHFPVPAWEILDVIIPILYVIWIILLGYVIIYNTFRFYKEQTAQQSAEKIEELKRQREIERKEIDMVRKSNEILLHLIQDEHREDR